MSSRHGGRKTGCVFSAFNRKTKNAYFCGAMNTANKSVVIIGAGNVGMHLAMLFREHGVDVTVACRDSVSAAKYLNSSVQLVPMQSIPPVADLYLLALKDSVIPEVAAAMPALEGIVAHTSGSIGLEPVSKFQKRGVFYPFQSFRKEIPLTVKDFPVLIEASDDGALSELKNIAGLISSTVLNATADIRAGIHTSGVFVSNFTNLMYRAGWDVAEMKKFNAPELLLPLIQETALRLQYKQPSELQTGPAIRNDRETIDKHLALLNDNTDLQQIYRYLTNALLKQYGHEELP